MHNDAAKIAGRWYIESTNNVGLSRNPVFHVDYDHDPR